MSDKTPKIAAQPLPQSGGCFILDGGALRPEGAVAAPVESEAEIKAQKPTSKSAGKAALKEA